MNAYQPRTKDINFILFDVLKAQNVLGELPALADNADPDLMRQVLEEAGTFVADVIAPLNRDGDEIGASWKDGAVTMAPGFREAYQAFCKAGWPALSGDPEDGGQGLPIVLEMVLYEWLSAANHGWTMAPGLLHGAYECIKHHASPELKDIYIPKLASGEWLSTMCLTEPQAGSDLGLVRTKAIEQSDGGFKISGTKIFISGGDHDLTDNIIHLVLARLPDSPTGPKGLSLFLVPKFYQDGSRSAVFCERIEEKMGLHGSPTCVMRFDEASGWLVGEHGKGLNAMFLMMNAARLHVSLQGVGLLDAAWQKADAYARDRRQMRAPVRVDPAQPADFIIEHPVIQRMLDTQRAWVDGGRVLAYQTALQHYLPGGMNRVVVLTDGAANLGDVDPDSLKNKVEAHRKQGVALDCFGIGWEGYNDDLLEMLTRNGDGRYGFVNTPEAATTEFAAQLAGALQVAASDVKVQVEFNPARVSNWRQVGYAKHQLTKQQFRDNTVDAAEIAAAEAGNGLYVIEVNPAGQGDIATVRVRYKVPGTTDYRELEWPVPYNGMAVPLEQASPAMRLMVASAEFSEWLASSPFSGEVSPDRLLGLLAGVPEVFGADQRPKKLEWMIRQAKSVSGKR